MQKYNKYKKQYEKDQQTSKSIDKSFMKSSQDNLIDESDYESLCKTLLSIWMNQKMNVFQNHGHKSKIELF